MTLETPTWVGLNDLYSSSLLAISNAFQFLDPTMKQYLCVDAQFSLWLCHPSLYLPSS